MSWILGAGPFPGKTPLRATATAGSAFSAALLVVQPILFFWRVLVNPQAHIPYDIEGFHLPLIAYVARCLREHVMPLWDPNSMCGMPIHADLQAQVFYPLTWLAIFAGNLSQGRTLFYWVEWLVPLHMILAGLFTFLLLRRMGLCRPAAFLGASVYQLGGYFASQTQHLCAICTAAWLPLAVLAVFELRLGFRIRWVSMLAMALALSLLSGFAATAVIVGGAVLLMVAALLIMREANWRIVPAVAAGCIFAVVLTAVELAPLWTLTHASIAAERARWHVLGGGLPLPVLVSLVFPDYYHIFEWPAQYKLTYNFTFLYAYCGIATLVLMALALVVRSARAAVFFVLTVLSAFWMLGENTPVYRSVYLRLPELLRGALYSEYALMAFCFFAAITAAIVLDRFRTRAPLAILWTVALLTSYDLIHTGAGRPMNTAPGGYRDHSLWTEANEVAANLRPLTGVTSPPPRVDYTDNLFSQGYLGPGMLRLPTADGDNPFMLSRMLHLRLTFGTCQPWERLCAASVNGMPLLSLMNVSLLAGVSPLSTEAVRKGGVETLEVVHGMNLYRNPRVLPRFYLAPRVRRSPNEAATFRMLSEPSFDPATEAVVEGIAENREGLAAGEVTVQRYTANRVELAVTAGGPAFLATSEVMYPGWEASVNGAARPLLMTNGAFRGLALPAGASQVVMEYRPRYLVLWLWVSILSTVLALAGMAPAKGEYRTTAARLREFWDGLWLCTQGLRDRLTAVGRRATVGWSCLFFIPTIVLFYWKILLTKQFSLLTENEGVNQAYSWLRFWIYSVRHWSLPIWDPYSWAGHSFPGEMQTAAFYPLHLLLALFPLNKDQVLSPFLYNVWWASAHLLAACFMFVLVREVGLSRFAAFVAGICFSLGGVVGGFGWPHMLESSIWLPVIFLFVLRAMRISDRWHWISNACFGALALGMSILAGGFHIVIMQVLAVTSAGIFYAAACGSTKKPRGQHWLKCGMVVAIVAIIGVAAGAVQLWPSMEYSSRALRWISQGALPATQKIPYENMNDALWPHGILTLIISNAFNGNLGQGEISKPYLGVFPLLAAIIGIRRNWHNPWIRYLTGLAIVVLLYSFGPFSWLHGVLYAVVPKLWMAREAPRMFYLWDFSLAILAAFGIETLFLLKHEALWPNLNRCLAALVSICAVCLLIPGIFGKPDISPWVSLSIVLIFASYALLHYIVRGNSVSSAQFLIVGLILFDLGAFDWTARGVMSMAKSDINHFDRNMSMQKAVNFLKSRPGPFRVQVLIDPQPNIGDLLAVPSISGGGVTLPTDFMRIMGNRDLLNARYLVRPASATEPGAIYQDPAWKVYENPASLPRAWVVHNVVATDYTGNQLFQFDPIRTALVDKVSTLKVDPAVGDAPETVSFSRFEANRLELSVHAQSRGLLILSETFYPGWHARVRGTSEAIYQVDGDLRGVPVPAGDSQVILTYKPMSVYGGGTLSLLALLGTLYCWRRSRRSPTTTLTGGGTAAESKQLAH